jgi:hydrogenase nickel incorporation protein HypA/HybF
VHELSIAHSIVETVSAAVAEQTGTQVREVRLRIGVLSGIMKESLLFCYDIAIQDTALAGSMLVVREVPVIIYCPVCGEEKELPGVQGFRCPVCDTPSGDIRQGRELEIESMVVDEYAST